MTRTIVPFDSAADWSKFTIQPINFSNNALILGATDGEGTIDGGAGDGNDRRLLLLNDFKARDIDARLDFRLPVNAGGAPQTGIVFKRPDALPIVFWTNIFFEASARVLLGAWEYDGTTLISTHQTSFLDDIEGQTFADPNRVRAMRVHQEGDHLWFRQWYTDTDEPGAWDYDGALPPGSASGEPAQVGMLVCHTGSRADIYVSSLTVTSLDKTEIQSNAEEASTMAFIKDNPFEVVLERSATVETPAGGTKKLPRLPLSPQLARLVESGLQGASATRHLPDGRVVNVRATLVLMPGADVQPGDTFVYNGEDWECGEISGRWATRAEAFRYGD